MKLNGTLPALLALACLPLAITSRVSAQDPAEVSDEAAAKHTIKDVMTVAHKDGLLKKVLAGDASDAEKKQLLDLYVSLVENRPEKGDAESWVQLSNGTVLAAAKVVTGREGAVEELKVATNCKACHSVHK